MKRVEADDKAITFQLSNRERETLIQILQAYPVVPPAHQSVSKDLKNLHVPEFQHLLDEALAEQRAAHKRHLDTWLAVPERFQKAKNGFRFKLDHADSEWLLQVLNDIRVGHWLRLGSPESGDLKPHKLGLKRLPTWLAMEMSGYFQMTILEALEA